jgi:hypothetical protein
MFPDDFMEDDDDIFGTTLWYLYAKTAPGVALCNSKMRKTKLANLNIC